MKKTLLITIDFSPASGGVARYLVGLAKNLPVDELVVLAPRVEKNYDNQFKFRVYRRKMFWSLWPQWLPLVWQIYKVAKREQVEMFWVAQPLPVGTAVYLVNKFFKLPYIVNTHGMDVAGPLAAGGRRFKILQKVLKSARTITVNSEYTKELVLKCGLNEDKIIKVYPCLTLNSQFPIPNSQLKEKYKNKKVLLTVGRLVARKGHDQVIKSLPQVLLKVPDLVYLIVGDGENKNNLLELIKSLKLEQNVVLEGFIPDEQLSVYFGLAKVFIMPAREEKDGDIEGFGLVFLEANSYGLPVIAGRSGGQTEAVIDGQTGLVVDPKNVDEIARAIIKLMTNQELAKKLAQQGRERVEQEFYWLKEADKITKILNG